MVSQTYRKRYFLFHRNIKDLKKTPNNDTFKLFNLK
jgi:hypothetical protein